MSIYYSKVFLKGTDYRISRSLKDDIFYRFEGYELVSTLPPIIPAELSTDTDLLVAPLIPGPSDTATALDLKIAAAVNGLLAGAPGALDTLNELAAALGDDPNFATTVSALIATKAPVADPTFSGTVQGVTKSMVGLGSVDNTTDIGKPVSTPQQTALDAKANTVDVYDKTTSDGKYAPLDNAKVYTSTSGDQTAALQAFLTALVDGDEALIRGTIDFTAVTIARNNVTIRLAPGAVLNKTTATTDGILVTGTNVHITGGSITCPATFDGSNVQPTYAVIRTTSTGTAIRAVKFNNVPKVGIYAEDTDDLKVTDCTIIGNYPAGSWTGVETGHFGIAVNPGNSGRSGRTIISGNLIRSCVQGVFLGNYGLGAGYGANIVGNIFDGCHNHGVYGSSGWAATTLTGNSFARCSLPIALNGIGHVVSGNTLYTDGTGNNLDLAGISIRESIGCTITGNTITGDAPVGAVIVECTNITGTTVSRNVISGNVIDVTGGSSIGIRVGRAPQTTDCSDNIIANNIVRTVGTVGSGAIAISTATTGAGNKVIGNDVIVRGESHGISVATASHCTVQNNTIRFEFDAASAKTLACVFLSAATYTTVGGNDFVGSAAFGTNVALRGVWEAGAVLNNRITGNAYHGDLTKLTSFTPISGVSASGVFIDELLPGVPGVFAQPGSVWHRSDGGAVTSLYVKESANTSAVWVAK